MQIGDLTRRARVQTKGLTKNAAQQLVEGWTDVFTRWANITTVTGAEKWLQGQQIANADTAITMRFDSGTRLIKPETHRLVEEDGTIIDITAAFDRTGQRQWWILLGTRRVI